MLSSENPTKSLSTAAETAAAHCPKAARQPGMESFVHDKQMNQLQIPSACALQAKRSASQTVAEHLQLVAMRANPVPRSTQNPSPMPFPSNPAGAPGKVQLEGAAVLFTRARAYCLYKQRLSSFH